MPWIHGEVEGHDWHRGKPVRAVEGRLKVWRIGGRANCEFWARQRAQRHEFGDTSGRRRRASFTQLDFPGSSWAAARRATTTRAAAPSPRHNQAAALARAAAGAVRLRVLRRLPDAGAAATVARRLRAAPRACTCWR